MGKYTSKEVRGPYLISKYRIIGTETDCVDVYERSPSSSYRPFSHSSICSHDGVWYGKLGTRDLSPEVDSLPVGPRRRDMLRYLQQVADTVKDSVLNGSI